MSFIAYRVEATSQGKWYKTHLSQWILSKEKAYKVFKQASKAFHQELRLVEYIIHDENSQVPRNVMEYRPALKD